MVWNESLVTLTGILFSYTISSASTCPAENQFTSPPLFCSSAPIKYANFSSPNYRKSGKDYLKLQLINQRSNFSFAFFKGGLTNFTGEKDSSQSHSPTSQNASKRLVGLGGAYGEDDGYEVIKKAIINLSLGHKEHIIAYGEGNERKLTGGG
ncbi:probable inactive purple acid phosphatase 1 [Arachis stenosperma]|uniref:probable inactive purple acid phosphatase 1 n=1 Tax=Arachis stenosperma TaxID=217475 RepID=UPI0025ABF20B|nr:probable inactive purple acid phosphatase 1 [Arachis stenosperma]